MNTVTTIYLDYNDVPNAERSQQDSLSLISGLDNPVYRGQVDYNTAQIHMMKAEYPLAIAAFR